MQIHFQPACSPVVYFYVVFFLSVQETEILLLIKFLERLSGQRFNSSSDHDAIVIDFHRVIAFT